jgi:hypothetical protein
LEGGPANHLGRGQGAPHRSVADKANPTEVGFFDTSGYACAVHVVGNYAYVADHWAGLRVISVADKANPTEAGFFDTPGRAVAVHVVGDYAYIADLDGGLVILRIIRELPYAIYLPLVLKNYGP